MTSELNKDMIILDWILNAKKCYINDLSRAGMCKAFKMAFQYVLGVNRNIVKLITDLGWEIEYLYGEPVYNCQWLNQLIPEFNFKELGGDKTTSDYRYYEKGAIPNINHIHWWDKNDINSRIKAFDYLIRVYTDKVNKSVIKQD